MAAQIWWMIHKDLVLEWRSRRAWPAMILLGIVVAVVFSLQIDLPFEYKPSDRGTAPVDCHLSCCHTEPRSVLRRGARGRLLAGFAVVPDLTLVCVSCQSWQ